jgi:hypothetical protein
LAFLLVRTINRLSIAVEAAQAAEAARPVQVAPTMQTRKRIKTRHPEALLELVLKVQFAPEEVAHMKDECCWARNGGIRPGD